MNTEAPELGPFSPVPDELILAAIGRAACHGSEPVWIAVVGEHLGFAHTPHNTRRLRTRLEELRVKEHCLKRRERYGRDYWKLTATGKTWLEALRHEGRIGELPESPQHREWRHAREEARRRVDDFRRLVGAALDDVYDARYHHAAPDSEAWFRLSERLAAALWLLGSATYCLEEWAEPDDARADIDADPGPPPGRRAMAAWKEKATTAKEAER